MHALMKHVHALHIYKWHSLCSHDTDHPANPTLLQTIKDLRMLNTLNEKKVLPSLSQGKLAKYAPGTVRCVCVCICACIYVCA